MDIRSLRLFVRIAQLGGVSRAAADLDCSAASASARLAKLEEEVGARLFHRTTRSVSLTTDGATFLPHAEGVLETIDQGLGAIGGHAAEPAGTLRMTMPGSFGRMHVMPALGRFATLYPRVLLDLVLSDEVLDVVEGAFDLIVRNTKPADSTMIARKLASDRRMLVASPRYLEAHGTPEVPADLEDHASVILGSANRWQFTDGAVIHPQAGHRVNDGEAMRLAIEAGMGIGLKSAWNVHASLRSGALVEVLPHHPLHEDTAIWALYPAGRLVPPRVRAMLDFLTELYSPVPPWEVPDGGRP
ncbi:MAG: LysR family transcriptional regulator [Acidobacteriota bacterium]